MKPRFKINTNSSVVSVECGSEHGTAFYVTEELLLTARHILADAAENSEHVVIYVADNRFTCDIVWMGDAANHLDLAILKCTGYKCPTPLQLLALPPDRKGLELTICGYPYEQGGGINQFEIAVTPVNNVTGREYDVITVPETFLGFSSYKGFSGAPVLNETGAVVGLTTDQMNAVLGYRSVFSISEVLEKNGLPYLSDWESANLRPYGLGHARQELEKQVGLAGDRYSSEIDIEDKGWDKYLEEFSSYEFGQEIERKLLDIESIYVKYDSMLPMEEKILDWNQNPYVKGDFSNLAFFLHRAEEMMRKSDKKSEIHTAIEQQLSEAMTQVYTLVGKLSVVKSSALAIEGDAGCGKTHLVCRFALKHASKCYAYLIHGKQLIPSESIENQICRICSFPDKDLSGFNRMMESVKKYGIIIIDAINECSAGTHWEEQLDAFHSVIEKYPFLKLIITVRTGTVRLSTSHWQRKMLIGFENLSNAINIFFEKNGISNFNNKKFQSDFRNPLFLKMFCQSYRYLYDGWKEKLKQTDVYLAYIRKRNVEISELVDEDISRNVTTRYLLKIASQSLFYEHCADIDREKARRLGDRICPGRGWKSSLLKNTLDENLLICIPNYEEGYRETIGFHFEKMGDFLRAHVLLESKMKDEQKIDWLVKEERYVTGNDTYKGKFQGLIGAFVSTHKGEKSLLDYPAFSKGTLKKYLVYALPYNSQYNGGIVRLLLEETTPDLVRALLNGFSHYDSSTIVTLHKELMRTTMPQRDYIWSEAVNQFYDKYSYDLGNWEIQENNDERKKALVLLSWLLTSSYPDVRCRIIRKIFAILSETPEGCLFLLKAFGNCNDPYVTEGILCAIYGVVLESRDAEFVSKVATAVQRIFYSDDRNIPTDIQIRTWSLKILERDKFLSPKSILFDTCTPPFIGTPNPFDYLNAESKAAGNEDFFGVSNGSKKVWHSLLGFADFARYVIGTNNSLTSDNFLYKDTEKPVPLNDIQEMVAQRIMELGWSDQLGQYDNARHSRNRHENKKERLGKKYLWVAYRDIVGRLCDFCKMKSKFEWDQPYTVLARNYPWYTSDVNHYDPTLRETIVPVGQIERDSPFGIEGKDGMEWVENDAALPSIQILCHDSEGEEWVFLYGYDSENVVQDMHKIEGFLFFNSHIVKAKDRTEVIKWVDGKNLYGRWLRETSDKTDFLWSEYPWADSYKYSVETDKWDFLNPRDDLQVKSMLSTLSQLQEDNRGLETEMYLSTAYAPCEDIMNVLNLYTAERGIVRDNATDDIVACSLNQLGIEQGGLAIKKRYLTDYLKKTESVIFFFIMGEKLASSSMTVTSSGIKELSSCWVLDENDIQEVQPLHVANRKNK